MQLFIKVSLLQEKTSQFLKLLDFPWIIKNTKNGSSCSPYEAVHCLFFYNTNDLQIFILCMHKS